MERILFERIRIVLPSIDLILFAISFILIAIGILIHWMTLKLREEILQQQETLEKLEKENDTTENI